MPARSASGWRRGSTQPGGSAAPTPRSSCCSRPTRTRHSASPAELETLNQDRQAVENRILRAAIAEVESWPEPKQRRRGYVIWGEDWHEGVIGIVASRLVERFNRPVVLIAGTDGQKEDASGKAPAARCRRSTCTARSRPAPPICTASAGTGRLRASRSCRTNLEAFAAAFAAHADAQLADDDLAPVTRIDAIVPGSALTLGLASELERLAPFGLGNPDVTLLVPGCEAVQPGVVGEGKHLRFRIRQGGRDAGSAIGFGLGAQLDRIRDDGHGLGRYDLACRLKENRWNGTIAPQLVIRRLFDAPDGYEELRASLAELWQAGEDAWTSDARAIFAELQLADGARRQLYESEAFRALLAGTALELPRRLRSGDAGRAVAGPLVRVVERDEQARELPRFALTALAGERV